MIFNLNINVVLLVAQRKNRFIASAAELFSEGKDGSSDLPSLE